MRSLIRFIVGLLMPVILIGAGGMVVGLGVNNNWELLIYGGFAMIGAGLIWGLLLWLWASDGGL
ncbi:MAG: hypothetical protein AAFY14_12450 [Pseudomonadota bacterium]